MKNYNMILTEKQQKYQHYHQEKLINMNTLQVKKYHLLIKEERYSKPIFSHSLLGNAFQKQIKTIEDQEEKQVIRLEEQGKQLAKYNNEKYSLTHSKQKQIFEELANKRMEEIQDFIKQIDFNSLTYRYYGNNDPKVFIGFKCPLGFYKNIKEDYITLEKAEEEEKRFKSEINKIIIGSKKS